MRPKEPPLPTRALHTPATLIVLSLAACVAMGIADAGLGNAFNVYVGVLTYAAVHTLLGLLGLYAAGTLLKLDLGPPGTAMLQMAAVVLTSLAVHWILPWPVVAWAAALAASWGLLAWFYFLRGRDLWWTVLIVFATKALAWAALMTLAG